MTLRPEEEGTKTLFVNTSKIAEEKLRTAFGGGGQRCFVSGFVPVDQSG